MKPSTKMLAMALCALLAVAYAEDQPQAAEVAYRRPYGGPHYNDLYNGPHNYEGPHYDYDKSPKTFVVYFEKNSACYKPTDSDGSSCGDTNGFT